MRLLKLRSGKEEIIQDLLNDESFISWIKGEAETASKKKWDHWLLQDPKHQVLVKKAKKVLDLPFKKHFDETDINEELERLKENIQ